MSFYAMFDRGNVSKCVSKIAVQGSLSVSKVIGNDMFLRRCKAIQKTQQNYFYAAEGK